MIADRIATYMNNRNRSGKYAFNSLVGILVFVLLFSCEQDEVARVRRIVFLGHIYNEDFSNRIHPELEKINYECFDLRLLGGDVGDGGSCL